jgi:hypothetical protein
MKCMTGLSVVLIIYLLPPSRTWSEQQARKTKQAPALALLSAGLPAL